MKIIIATEIDKNFKTIFSKFNVELFKALKPPFLNLKIDRFDGCLKDHEIHLQVDLFGKMNQSWISLITDFVETENEIYFIDEGKLIPKPLKKWHHKHRIIKINSFKSVLIDEINFDCGFEPINWAIYPTLYLMFYYRKHIYIRELS